MRTGLYILGEDGKPVACEDAEQWGRFFETASRIVRQEAVSPKVSVSTVFLGIDHNFGRGGPPLLYETMIFGGREDGYCERYATREEAELGHVEAVARAKESVQ